MYDGRVYIQLICMAIIIITRIERDRDTIKAFVADKFKFKNVDSNFHLLDNLNKEELMERLITIGR